MKLLIVDDEVNTRKGIIGRLPLSEMGITEVCEADDGINGLKAVSTFEPDIILTDVRMPRMDGVEMVYKVREQLTACQVIFMSGYSDKEYLKSAIELKALNYIEKPINMNELKSALQASISLCDEERNKNKLLKTSLTLIRNELALQLVSRTPDWLAIAGNIKAAQLDIPQEGIFVTALLRIHTDISIEQLNSYKITFENILETVNRTTGHSAIWTVKNDEYIIVHLFGNKHCKHLFSGEKLHNACQLILNGLSSSFSVFLSLGKTVNRADKIYSSYESAVLGIQRAFYYGYNSIIKFSEANTLPYRFKPQIIKDFSELISKGDQGRTQFLIKSLTSDIRRFDTTLVNECKDFYYRILLELVKASTQYGSRLPEVPELDTDIWEMFLKFSTLMDMESFILRQIDLYFQCIANININDSSVINAIQYIKHHYHEESMSISLISEYTSLSPTYLSSVFKKITGKTLVKYINDYRMEKARELLKNKKLKITDISTQVGCGDSNYFTKIFRKTCGLTPSEYREMMLK